LVKAADNRIRKYTQKFDPTVISNRYTNLKDLAVAEFGVAAGEAAALEATVKQAIEAMVPSPTLLPGYLAFARQVAAKGRKYGGMTLYNEAMAVTTVWAARAYDPTVLDIILKICGINVGMYGGS
jgi:hypothetical protein